MTCASGIRTDLHGSGSGAGNDGAQRAGLKIRLVGEGN